MSSQSPMYLPYNNLKPKFTRSYKKYEQLRDTVVEALNIEPEQYDPELSSDKFIVEIPLPEFHPVTGQRLEFKDLQMVVKTRTGEKLYTETYIKDLSLLLIRFANFVERFRVLFNLCNEMNKYFRATLKRIDTHGFEHILKQAIMRRVRLFRLREAGWDASKGLSKQLIDDIIADPTPLFEGEEADQLLQDYDLLLNPDHFDVERREHFPDLAKEVKNVG